MDADAFYVELTDTLRVYIEAVFDLPATESTTPEFLAELNRSDSKLTPAQRDMLGEVLGMADMVKFAKGTAEESQLSETLTRADAFIKDTRLSASEQESAA